MVSPVARVIPQTLAGVGDAGLQAQLDKARKELADCVGCASAKTPQGQQAIQRASDKVARLEGRIERNLQGEKIATGEQAPIKGGVPVPQAESASSIDVYA